MILVRSNHSCQFDCAKSDDLPDANQTLDDFMCKRHDNWMLIYKIFRTSEWDALQSAGQTLGAPVDLADGYIHFSTAETLGETAAKYFAGQGDLVLVAVNADLAAPLRWEPARGGVLFPHLYRAMTLADVVWMKPLPLGADGAHILPDLS
jgi:uncharacterized protein (DUF952 family)